MAETVTLAAERREDTGTGAARKLRREGKIPAVIYGHGREPEALAVQQAEADKLLQTAGSSTVIELSVDGTPVRTLIREIQRHPTRKNITHLDFLEIHAGERLTVDVPLYLVGSPDGVRHAGGVLEQFLREIEIEVLPKDIPVRQMSGFNTLLSSRQLSALAAQKAKVKDVAQLTSQKHLEIAMTSRVHLKVYLRKIEPH